MRSRVGPPPSDSGGAALPAARQPEANRLNPRPAPQDRHPSDLHPVGPGRAELLRRFLEAYWLRPENALWMTLRSQALSACPSERPFMDVSCGDGVFSFLHCGGVFDRSFDVFTSVAQLDRVRDQHADMFDHCAEDYRPAIAAPPPDTLDVGTDCKASMLAKASRLNLYSRLVEHDNNRPLPFENGLFQTVYCNAAYWVSAIDAFLGELARVVRPKGWVILQVKLEAVRRYTLAAHEAALGRRVLDLIGRGRTECWPTLADRATWERRFARAGLRIRSATPFVTRTHAHLWDIGLRPIAPMLAKMANSLTAQTRTAVKQEWVDLFCELLGPLCDPAIDLFSGEDEPAEMQYVLGTS